mmetsp:Transcript_64123/g.165029  ORF Transcript_64123/g.165029 Transcript_64123/m.165029 type:complete len:224 (-) Transcript_64123:2208-2879(-)
MGEPSGAGPDRQRPRQRFMWRLLHFRRQALCMGRHGVEDQERVALYSLREAEQHHLEVVPADVPGCDVPSLLNEEQLVDPLRRDAGANDRVALEHLGDLRNVSPSQTAACVPREDVEDGRNMIHNIARDVRLQLLLVQVALRNVVAVWHPTGVGRDPVVFVGLQRLGATIPPEDLADDFAQGHDLWCLRRQGFEDHQKELRAPLGLLFELGVGLLGSVCPTCC